MFASDFIMDADIIFDAKRDSETFKRVVDSVKKAIREAMEEENQGEHNRECACGHECSGGCCGCGEKEEVPEIVYCRDCINVNEKGFCNVLGQYTKPNGFCHLGREKEDKIELTDAELDVLSSLYALGFKDMISLSGSYYACYESGYISLLKPKFSFLDRLAEDGKTINIEKILAEYEPTEDKE